MNKIKKIMKKIKIIYREMTIDDLLYCIAVFVALLLLICFILYKLDIMVPTDTLPGCRFKAKTGISCYGCGMTRAFQSLFDGNIIASVSFNPIALYFTVLLICYIISNSVALIRNIPIKGKSYRLLYPHMAMKFRVIYIYVGLIIDLIFGTVRIINEIKAGLFILQ